MGVPFEALLPYGIMIAMFTATGAGMGYIRSRTFGGTRGRYSMDQWDKNMLERDQRLTGDFRNQVAEPVAPKGFATSSMWKLEKVSHWGGGAV